MWRAIWNGPFYIGKLERPISVGDALMKVLETLWRAAIVALVAFGLFVAALSYDSWRQNRRDEVAGRTVVIDARANFSVCPSDYPILVAIRNEGRKTISYVSYRIEIIDPALSVNIAPSHLDSLHAENIPSGGTMMSCQSPYTSYGSSTGFSFRPEHRVRGLVTWVRAAD
jgi:hypothetical protein